jgi:2'-5' RNA ligase
VLAANAVSTPQLLRLFSTVESKVVEAGLPAESRLPHPHVTMARFRQRHFRPPEEILESVDLEYECRELVMFRSVLGPSGVKYDRYGVVPLTPGS